MKLVFTVLVALVAAEVAACGSCVYAAADTVAPPVFFWMWLSLSWFVANGIIRSATGAALALQPKLILSVVLALAGFFAGGALLGPLAVFPLAVPPIIAFVIAVSRRSKASPAAQRSIVWVGSAHLLAAAVGVALLLNTLHTRTEADFIAEWSGTATARLRFNRLKSQEPASLNTYRELVREGDSSIVADAAERIAEIGDPQTDIALLRDALPRFTADASTAGRITVAMNTLRERLPRQLLPR